MPSLLSGQGDALAQDQADEETNAEAGALDRAGETTAPAVAAGADDLCRIKGIGAKMAARLAALGVARFAEIAAWEAKDVAHFDDVLAGIPGRIRRDDWVGQARAMV